MLKIYNSLSRKVEEFKPVHAGSLNVGMYTCGPTVYDFAHIGNFRTYTTSDLLLRTLQYNGYEVDSVMNITDVGHLTGDNQGDADTGDDRMEKSALREGKSAWEIAEFYTDAFLKDFTSLNLTSVTHLVKATDHIKEQIDLIKTLEEKGYTYKTSDGIYFDTTMFPEYGKLSNLDQIQEGARVEVNPEKHNPRDFALWKFSPVDAKRQMEWDSPWGVGFPGWHIECSAMAMKYLGSSFDIHVGGIDLRETHHPNEIAQSEAATGKPFAKYWVHGAFILVQGERMSKSKGNNYKLYDLEKQGFDALALRYLYMQAHYRQEMNFTMIAMEAAQKALNRIREAFIKLEASEESIGVEKSTKEYEHRFLEAINNDLNFPEATAVLWEVLKSDLSDAAKRNVLLKFDRVLGLDLEHAHINRDREDAQDVPQEIREMVNERKRLRNDREFKAADALRDKIQRLGYDLDDSEKGTRIKKIK
jgi:cysteinyl-tRNA synthetase